MNNQPLGERFEKGFGRIKSFYDNWQRVVAVVAFTGLTCGYFVYFEPSFVIPEAILYTVEKLTSAIFGGGR